MQIKALAYFASAFVVTLGATTQDVLNDINALRYQLDVLDINLNDFSGGMAEAMAIHDVATNVQYATDYTTTDVQGIPSPISEAGAQSILDAFNGITPIIKDSLRAIVTKKVYFESIPLECVSITRDDLSNFAESASDLVDALIASTHPDFLDEAHALKHDIDAAFVATIAAFA